MIIIKGLLKENLNYYRGAERKLVKCLAAVPKGSIKKRRIGKKRYYYLQERRGAKIIHRYLGKNEPKALMDELKKRERLSAELKKVREALRILKKTSIKRKKK